ncbi:MAG: chorismate mutase / prephenate dehydratase [Candidatus Sumerlaeota bacterium]|nr:chorismate mutase / prephenate dehydratase [Candidatus Sumerlaeota bacterium]
MSETNADLSAQRQEIDEIDRHLVELLDRRARIARDVGRAKATTGSQTFDAGRHRAVLERALGRGDGSFPREGLQIVMREVLSTCLNLQKPLTVAYLGPAATFSHQAALNEFGSAPKFEPFERIRDIFDAIHKGKGDYGVVPIENSTGGMVHDTLDLFIEFDVRICHEILLPIQHSLLGLTPIEEVTAIYSHPQTFKQCANWLSENLPKAEFMEVASTVIGMRKAKEIENTAAIGSHIAADQYGLRILARGIEDNPDNTTRFLVIAKADTPSCGDDKTSVMFSIKDKPGVLYSLLKPFADRNINLSQIESRPTKRKAWEYVFFVDLLGHRDDERVKAAIAETEQNCHWLRVLGSYPRHREGPQKMAFPKQEGS